MNSRTRGLFLARVAQYAIATACIGFASAACGDDDDSSVADAGADADASPDGAQPDAGETPAFGPCKADADCPDGTFCDVEQSSSIPVRGAPSGMVEQALFPGGSCSPKPLAEFDDVAACDSSLPQPVQGCGTDGVCVLEGGSAATLAACRASCEPAAASSGCSRDGYTCDFGLHACIEGCRADTECRILVQDNDGDGEADTLAYDTASRAVCDPKTARCTHPGNASVPVGSTCERLDDCSAGGQCLEGSDVVGGISFPGGYCSSVGCDVPGRECAGDDTVCEPLRPWFGGASDAPLCLISCVVGAETPDQRVGSEAHGVGCRPGYRCHYNGGVGKDSGVCVGGTYNDVQRNNIGQACTSDDECYSPYGYGACLLYAATEARIRPERGSCSIVDCNAPGLPENVCGAGNECVRFARDLTFCIHNCATAEECATGYACADEDGDPSTAKVCYPACAIEADCRTQERCQLAQGTLSGRCVAMAGSGG